MLGVIRALSAAMRKETASDRAARKIAASRGRGVHSADSTAEGPLRARDGEGTPCFSCRASAARSVEINVKCQTKIYTREIAVGVTSD